MQLSDVMCAFCAKVLTFVFQLFQKKKNRIEVSSCKHGEAASETPGWHPPMVCHLIPWHAWAGEGQRFEGVSSGLHKSPGRCLQWKGENFQNVNLSFNISFLIHIASFKFISSNGYSTFLIPAYFVCREEISCGGHHLPFPLYLEALPSIYQGKHEDILKHKREDGSLFHSPSATACAFIITGDRDCKQYLEAMVQRCRRGGEF